MKTIDAVIEFKGETTFAGYYHYNNRFHEWIKSGHEYINSGHQKVCTHEELNQLVSELSTNFGTSMTYTHYKLAIKSMPFELTEEVKPVYTQAMSDKGVMPSAGMEAEFDTTFFTSPTSNKGTCEIIAYFEGKVWINIIDFDCVINLNVIDFKPLTPPIELIDGKAYQFTNIEDNTIHGLYDEDERAFKSLNVEWCENTCTNIQLLEVKS